MRLAVPLLVLVSCGACATRHATAPSWAPPVAVKTFDVDSRFSPDELADIVEAANRLESQTRGRVRLRLFVPGGFPITRREDEDEETEQADTYFDSSIYAWTATIGKDRGVNLIEDRQNTRTIRVRVAMHELLHAFGVHHVSGDARAVMAPTVTADGTGRELTSADVRAICQAIGCTPWAR